VARTDAKFFHLTITRIAVTKGPVDTRNGVVSVDTEYRIGRIATRLAPRKELKRRPFLGLHPDFAVPPSVSTNRNFSATTRTRSE
jgi:hypothetical protein